MEPKATASEVWFDEYVRSRGQEPGKPHPDLGISAKPDRLITWNGHEVVCEIKQFESSPYKGLPEGGGVIDVTKVLGQVRRKITRAATEQLKPLADSDWPLVIVLANPKGYPVSFSGWEMVSALYGDPVIQIPINTITGAASGPAIHTVGKNGRMLRNHQYVSAVVALHQGSHQKLWHDTHWTQLQAEADLDPGDLDGLYRLANQLDEMQEAALANGEIEDGTYLFVEVFTATSQTAVPLPRDVFDGPRDSRWDYDPVAGKYAKTRG